MSKDNDSLLKQGLSEKQTVSKDYKPATSGEGQRPSPPKRESIKGGFTIV